MKCEIDDARMFLQVIRESSDPLAVFREAVSNSYDARASRVRIIVRASSKDTVDIEIHDNGLGVKRNEFRYFFGLGFGNKDNGDFIGSKGLGTKLYFKGKQIKVTSRLPTGRILEGVLDDPLGDLEAGRVPSYYVRELKSAKTPYRHGTSIRVIGLRVNAQSPIMSTESIASYLRWYTMAGSCHKIFGLDQPRSFVVELVREGSDNAYRIEGHELPGFGARSSSDYNTFSEAFDPFQVWLEDSTGSFLGTLEIAGSIVGPHGHIVTDRRIKKRFKGVFLAKDYFIIRNVNTEVFGGTGEWQNTHIVANCQQLHLSMGRGDFVDKTSGLVYQESISALREFANALKRGEPFRYKGRRVEISDRYAGALYHRLKSLRTLEAKVELENMKALDLLSVSNVPMTPLADDGGPVFQPVSSVGVMLLFQALVSKGRRFKESSHDSHGIRFRIMGYAQESGGYLVLQKKRGRKWSRPLFYKPVLVLKDDMSGSLDNVDGVLCWSNGMSASSTNQQLDVVVLKDFV